MESKEEFITSYSVGSRDEMRTSLECLDPQGKGEGVPAIESQVVDSDAVIHPVKGIGFAGLPIPVGGQGGPDDRAMSVVPRHVRSVSVEGVVGDQAGGEASGGGRILAYQNGCAVGLAYRKVEPGGD